MNSIEAIKARRSVRTYDGNAISTQHLNSIETEIKTLSATYGVKLTLMKNNFNGKQLGTYGVIKNAVAYLACVCTNDTPSLLNAGMALEKAVVHCTSLGIGTCWLGGTFKRDEFGSAVTVAPGEVIPAVISAGYPSAKEKGLVSSIVRRTVKPQTRKPFEELFFDRDFSHPLSQSNPSAMALEMVRIGPSASNKQPWRVVKDDTRYHFFLEHTPGYGNKYAFDMQLLDIGIAMSHFELAMQSDSKNGTWETLHKDFDNLPPNTEYIASWIVL